MKKGILNIAGLLLFLFSFYWLSYEIEEFRNFRNDVKESPAEFHVSGIYINQKIGSFQNAFAAVEDQNGQLPYFIKIRISEAASLSIGDPLTVYLHNGKYIAESMITQKTTVHYLKILLAGIIPLLYSLYIVLGSRISSRLFDKLRQKFSIRAVSSLLLIGISLLFFVSALNSIHHLYQAFSGELHKVEVEVLDKESTKSGARKHGSYYLSFIYPDTKGTERFMKLEVPYGVYRTNQSSLTIQYPEEHPLHVSAVGYSARDIPSLLKGDIALALFFAVPITLYYRKIFKNRKSRSRETSL